MTGPINKLWIGVGLPAILAAAIGVTVALAQDDAPTAPGEGSTLLQQEPSPTPTPAQTPPSGDDSDDATPEKDCPRDGGSGDSDEAAPSPGAASGVSFPRR